MGALERIGVFVYDDDKKLTYPEGHPFRPERAGMLRDYLTREGFFGDPRVTKLVPEMAAVEELARFHGAEYLAGLERAGRGDFDLDLLELGLGTEDCPAFNGLFELARLAAGATLEGARAIGRRDFDLVFNPVGGFHHAHASLAEGFCYVNDVVLAASELAALGRKVAVVDLDVHHGNGTEAAFIAEPRVLTVSVHESGETLYPWGGFERRIGDGPGRGYNINVPLPVGTDDVAYRRAFDGIALPIVRAFAPDAIILEIGMDVLAGDPLAHLRLTNNGVADAVMPLADLGAPILCLGGGGYNPESTARGWAVALLALTGTDNASDFAAAVGGVFLGDTGRPGGLRDMRAYAGGELCERLEAEIDKVIAFHRRTTFPIHGISV